MVTSCSCCYLGQSMMLSPLADSLIVPFTIWQIRDIHRRHAAMSLCFHYMDVDGQDVAHWCILQLLQHNQSKIKVFFMWHTPFVQGVLYAREVDCVILSTPKIGVSTLNIPSCSDPSLILLLMSFFFFLCVWLISLCAELCCHLPNFPLFLTA